MIMLIRLIIVVCMNNAVQIMTQIIDIGHNTLKNDYAWVRNTLLDLS